MKKALKIAVVFAAIAAMLMSFAACGGKEEAKTEENGETAQPIVFGTNPEFPPFEFVNGNGGVIENYDGIDMAIAKKIGEDNGREAKIESIEFDSLLIALQNGKIDAAIAGMTVTPKRQKSVDFSTPYYKATQVMIVKDADIKSAKDMADKKIVVIQGYTGETCVKNMGYKYEAFKKGSEANVERKNGKCDVVVIDSATAQKYIKDNTELKIVEDAEAFDSEEYAIAVKKGNTELLNKINASIEKMLADGTISELAAQYQ